MPAGGCSRGTHHRGGAGAPHVGRAGARLPSEDAGELDEDGAEESKMEEVD